MSTPVIDVSGIVNTIIPLMSVFITMFLMVYIFKSLKDVFAGL